MSGKLALVSRESLSTVLKTILAPSYRDGSSHVVLTSYYGTMDALVHDLFSKLQEETEKGTPMTGVMVDEGELTSALQEAGYSMLVVVGAVMGILRKRTPMAPSAQSHDTITKAELAAAMTRIGYADMTSPGHAESIFENALAHRKPKWKEGDAVKDCHGLVWHYHGDAWYRPVPTGVISRTTEQMSRPLTPLVPKE